MTEMQSNAKPHKAQGCTIGAEGERMQSVDSKTLEKSEGIFAEDELKSQKKSVVEAGVAKRADDSKLRVENTSSKQNILHADGSLDVVASLRLYLDKIGAGGLLCDEDLLTELSRFSDPFSSEWGTKNPGLFIFSSFLWDLVLKTQYTSDTPPSTKMRNLRNSFIEEMIPYVTYGLDLGLLTSYSKRLETHGLRFSRTDNFYEIPAILRVLTPSYDVLVESNSDPRQFFMHKCLEGLPHGVLMYPWDHFKLYDIKVLRTPKNVS